MRKETVEITFLPYGRRQSPSHAYSTTSQKHGSGTPGSPKSRATTGGFPRPIVA